MSHTRSTAAPTFDFPLRFLGIRLLLVLPLLLSRQSSIPSFAAHHQAFGGCHVNHLYSSHQVYSPWPALMGFQPGVHPKRSNTSHLPMRSSGDMFQPLNLAFAFAIAL